MAYNMRMKDFFPRLSKLSNSKDSMKTNLLNRRNQKFLPPTKVAAFNNQQSTFWKRNSRVNNTAWHLYHRGRRLGCTVYTFIHGRYYAKVIFRGIHYPVLFETHTEARLFLELVATVTTDWSDAIRKDTPTPEQVVWNTLRQLPLMTPLGP